MSLVITCSLVIKQKKYFLSLINLIKNPEDILSLVFIFYNEAVACNNDISFRKRVESTILFSLIFDCADSQTPIIFI